MAPFVPQIPRGRRLSVRIVGNYRVIVEGAAPCWGWICHFGPDLSLTPQVRTPPKRQQIIPKVYVVSGMVKT